MGRPSWILSLLVGVLSSLPIQAQAPALTRYCEDQPATSSSPAPFFLASPTTPAAVPTTVISSASAEDQAAYQTLSQARDAITKLIQNDNSLVPQFLRMGFHDCVGGCDGTSCMMKFDCLFENTHHVNFLKDALI
jgi:hypothetical protein